MEGLSEVFYVKKIIPKFCAYKILNRVLPLEEIFQRSFIGRAFLEVFLKYKDLLEVFL